MKKKLFFKISLPILAATAAVSITTAPALISTATSKSFNDNIKNFSLQSNSEVETPISTSPENEITVASQNNDTKLETKIEYQYLNKDVKDYPVIGKIFESKIVPRNRLHDIVLNYQQLPNGGQPRNLIASKSTIPFLSFGREDLSSFAVHKNLPNYPFRFYIRLFSNTWGLAGEGALREHVFNISTNEKEMREKKSFTFSSPSWEEATTDLRTSDSFSDDWAESDMLDITQPPEFSFVLKDKNWYPNIFFIASLYRATGGGGGPNENSFSFKHPIDLFNLLQWPTIFQSYRVDPVPAYEELMNKFVNSSDFQNDLLSAYQNKTKEWMFSSVNKIEQEANEIAQRIFNNKIKELFPKLVFPEGIAYTEDESALHYLIFKTSVSNNGLTIEPRMKFTAFDNTVHKIGESSIVIPSSKLYPSSIQLFNFTQQNFELPSSPKMKTNEPEIPNISNVPSTPQIDPQPLNLDSRSLRYNDHYLTRPLKDWASDQGIFTAQPIPPSKTINGFKQKPVETTDDNTINLLTSQTNQLQFSPISIDWEKLLPNRTDLSKQELAKLYLPFVIFTPKIKQQLTLSKTIDDQVIDGKPACEKTCNPLTISLPFSFSYDKSEIISSLEAQKNLTSTLELEKYFKSDDEYSKYENITFDDFEAISQKEDQTTEDKNKMIAFLRNSLYIHFLSDFSNIKWTLNSYGDLVLDLTTTTELSQQIGKYIKNVPNLKEVLSQVEYSIAEFNYTRKNIIGFTQSIIDFLNENKQEIAKIFEDFLPNFNYIYNSSSTTKDIKQEVASILYNFIVSHHQDVNNFSKDLIFNDNFIRVDINSHSSSTIEFTLTPTIKDWNGNSASRNPITFNYTKPSLDDIDPNTYNFKYLNYSITDEKYPVWKIEKFADFDKSASSFFGSSYGNRYSEGNTWTSDLSLNVDVPLKGDYSSDFLIWDFYSNQKQYSTASNCCGNRFRNWYQPENHYFLSERQISEFSQLPSQTSPELKTSDIGKHVNSTHHAWWQENQGWAGDDGKVEGRDYIKLKPITPFSNTNKKVSLSLTKRFYTKFYWGNGWGSQGMDNYLNFYNFRYLYKNPLPAYKELFSIYSQSAEFQNNFKAALTNFLAQENFKTTKELLLSIPTKHLEEKVREIFNSLVTKKWQNLKFVEDLTNSESADNYLVPKLRIENNKLLINFNFAFTDVFNTKHKLSFPAPIVFDLDLVSHTYPNIYNQSINTVNNNNVAWLSTIPVPQLMEQKEIQEHIKKLNENNQLNSPHESLFSDNAKAQWTKVNDSVQGEKAWLDFTTLVTNKPKVPELRWTKEELAGKSYEEVAININNYFNNISPLFATQYIYWDPSTKIWKESLSSQNQIYFSPELLQKDFNFKFDYRLILNPAEVTYKNWEAGTLPLTLYFFYDTNTSQDVFNFINQTDPAAPPSPPAPNSQTYWHVITKKITLTGFQPINFSSFNGLVETDFHYEKDKTGKQLAKYYQTNINNAEKLNDILAFFSTKGINNTEILKFGLDIEPSIFNKFLSIFGNTKEFKRYIDNLLKNSVDSFESYQDKKYLQTALTNKLRDSISLEVTPGIRDFGLITNPALRKQLESERDLLISAGLKTIRIFYKPISNQEYVSKDIFLATKAPKYFVIDDPTANIYTLPSLAEASDVVIKYSSRNVFPENISTAQLQEIIAKHVTSTYGNTNRKKADGPYGVNLIQIQKMEWKNKQVDNQKGEISFDSVKIKVKKNLYASYSDTTEYELLDVNGDNLPDRKLIIKCKSFEGLYPGKTITKNYHDNPEYNFINSTIENQKTLEEKFKRWRNKPEGRNTHVDFLSEFIPNIGNTDYNSQNTQMDVKVVVADKDELVLEFKCFVKYTNQTFIIKTLCKNYWKITPPVDNPEQNNNNNNNNNSNNNNNGGPAGSLSSGNLIEVPGIDQTSSSSISSPALVVAIVAGSLVGAVAICLLVFLILKNKKWIKPE